MYMGSYGAASPKPTHLWAPSPAVSMFSLLLPSNVDWEQVVDRSVLSNGKVSVSGNKTSKPVKLIRGNLVLQQVRFGTKLGLGPNQSLIQKCQQCMGPQSGPVA